MPDQHVTDAKARVAEAKAALVARDATALPNPAQEAHDAAAKALDKAKLACSDECGPVELPEDFLERQLAIAEAEAHHAPHRATLEAAYAEFARTGHALGDAPQAPSNPAGEGVTDIEAHIVVSAEAGA
jgi:hypothetical protein